MTGRASVLSDSGTARCLVSLEQSPEATSSLSGFTDTLVLTALRVLCGEAAGVLRPCGGTGPCDTAGRWPPPAAAERSRASAASASAQAPAPPTSSHPPLPSQPPSLPSRVVCAVCSFLYPVSSDTPSPWPHLKARACPAPMPASLRRLPPFQASRAV